MDEARLVKSGEKILKRGRSILIERNALSKLVSMTVEQIKEELRHMDVPVLQELTSFILQLRRSHDPERSSLLAEMLDSPERKWLSLEEMDERLDSE